MEVTKELRELARQREDKFHEILFNAAGELSEMYYKLIGAEDTRHGYRNIFIGVGCYIAIGIKIFTHAIHTVNGLIFCRAMSIGHYAPQ